MDGVPLCRDAVSVLSSRVVTKGELFHGAVKSLIHSDDGLVKLLNSLAQFLNILARSVGTLDVVVEVGHALHNMAGRSDDWVEYLVVEIFANLREELTADSFEMELYLRERAMARLAVSRIYDFVCLGGNSLG